MWQGGSLAGSARPTPTATVTRSTSARRWPAEIRARTGIETVSSELTYDLRSGEADSLDQMVAMTFANVAMDLIAEGSTAGWWRSATATTRTPTMPDPALGPRKVDVERHVRRGALPAALLGQARRAAAPARDAVADPA